MLDWLISQRKPLVDYKIDKRFQEIFGSMWDRYGDETDEEYLKRVGRVCTRVF